jgi:phosphoribosylamine--glycine ligase
LYFLTWTNDGYGDDLSAGIMNVLLERVVGLGGGSVGMRVLVVGGGSREHALLWKLAQSSRVDALFCAPGNAGTAGLATNLPIRATDIDGIVIAAKEQAIDLVVVGPEDPLALGLVDRLTEAGIRVFGPNQAAARIESSKSWAKELMTAAGVPTARSRTVDRLDAAVAALNEFSIPVVIKADGLAAGKGVVVAQSADEAFHVLAAFLDDKALGDAASTVVIEECMTGMEVSILALTDGETVVPLVPACDYKRAGDGDRGPNTGGMGGYAPVPAVTPDLLETVLMTILEPTVRTMRERGTPMKGVLYAGLMLTDAGPKVVEFNARFGDPETQMVLALLESDLVELILATTDGTLANLPQVSFKQGAAVGVVLASGGYPAPFRTGLPISGLDNLPENVLVFHGGTKPGPAGEPLTSGGRVLTVVGLGGDLARARETVYAAIERIGFEDAHFRRDIAVRELASS